MLNLLNRDRTVKNRSERGAYVVITVLMLLMLIGFLSVGIDIAVLAAARTQQKHNAELAALAALEAFNADHSTDPIDRVAAAAARASAITGINITHTAESALRAAPSATRAEFSTTKGVNEASGTHGRVVLGRWYTDGNTSCPDRHNGTSSTSPCFVPSSVDNSLPPNAVRVYVRTDPQDPLTPIFGSLLHQSAVAMESFSTAAIVPRRVVFLVDLSPSVTWDSHPQGQGEFMYYINPNTGLNCESDEIKALTPGSQEFQQFFGGTYPRMSNVNVLYGTHSAEWNNTFGGGKFAASGTYRCLKIDGIDDVPALGMPSYSSQSYLIDTSARPEPYHAILGGIQSALERFESRKVSGDKIGFIGFDDDILGSRVSAASPEPRLMHLPSNAGLIDPQSNTVGSEYNHIKDALKISDFTVGDPDQALIDINSALTYKFFLPRYFGKYATPGGTRRSRAYTDFTLALKGARDMLAAEPGMNQAENLIVAFSDGLGNCAGLAYPEDQSYPGDWGIGVHRCENSDFYLQQSLYGSLDLQRAFSSMGIATNMFLVGEQVKPHTRVMVTRRSCDSQMNCVNDGLAGCVTEDYYRAHRDLYPGTARGGTPFENMVDSNSQIGGPRYGPNAFYEMTFATGGLWAPLRPSCIAPGASRTFYNQYTGSETITYDQCRNVADPKVVKYMDRYCNFMAPSNQYFMPSAYGSGLTFEYRDRNGDGFVDTTPPSYQDQWMSPVCAIGHAADENCSNPDIEDGARLECDPTCRTKSEQVLDYMGQLLKQTPYVLVE